MAINIYEFNEIGEEIYFDKLHKKFQHLNNISLGKNLDKLFDSNVLA